MKSHSFPKSLHIRRGADFDLAYAAKLFAADEMLVVNGAPNGLAHPRLGLSVSRKVGNAVVRNRWKRLIREAFRLNLASLPAGVDLVVRPQKEAIPSLERIAPALIALARRIQKKLGRPAPGKPAPVKPAPQKGAGEAP